MPRWDLPGLEVVAEHPGLALHALASGRVWASRGYRILALDLHAGKNAKFQCIARLDEPLWRRAAGRVALVGQALRLGLHHVVPLPSGALLACTSGRLLRRHDGQGFAQVLALGFRKPTRTGLTVTRQGTVWLGEYSLNPDRRRPSRVWRSDDDGRTFQVAHTFAPGQVRHVHFVQEDPHDGALWLGTGDADAESAVYRSADGGRTWDVVGRGGQQWRTLGLCFSPEAVLWGTDAGTDAGTYANRLVRFERASGRVDELQRVQGPVHAATTLPGGGMLFATGLEGGANETDGRVHLWHSPDGQICREVASFADGPQPRRVQYAIAHFAPGQPDHARIFIGLRGVAGMAQGIVEVRLR